MQKLLLTSLFIIALSHLSFAQGNIGVGEATPATKLEIKGDGGDLLNIKDNSNDSKLYIESDGNIGIGTTNPVSKLEIFNSTAFDTNESFSGQDHLVFDATDPGSGGLYGGLTWRSGSRRRAAIAATREAADSDYVGLAFFTQGTDGPGPFYESMRISHSGNVGIGTQSPAAKLEVWGNLLLHNGTAVNEFSIDYTLSGSSNNAIPTERAVKIYVDNNDDNTTYSAGNQLTLSGTTFNLSEGSGSGLDADLLDGQNGSYYLDNTDNQNLSNVLSNGNSAGGSSINMNGNPITGIGSGTRMNLGEGLEFTSEDLGQGNDGRIIRIKDSNTPNAPDGHIMFVSGDDNAKLIEMYDVGVRIHTGLDMQSNKVFDMADPTSPQDAATKAYVDAQVGGVTESDPTWSGSVNTSSNIGRTGRVGIGTTSPSQLLEVSASSGAYILVNDEGTRGDAFLELNRGDDGKDEAMVVFANAANKDWYAGIPYNCGGNTNQFVISAESYLNACGGTTYTPEFLIDAAGDVGIGVSNPSYKLHVNGRLRTNGINETSDLRFKKNIEPLNNSLNKLMQIRGVSYNWRQDEFPDRKFKDGKDLGVIAQEVEKILPEVVDTDNEGYKSVQYSHLVPVLIEAMKEQQTMINTQKQEISHLQEKDTEQIARLNEQQQLINELKADRKTLNTLQAELELIKQQLEMTAKHK